MKVLLNTPYPIFCYNEFCKHRQDTDIKVKKKYFTLSPLKWEKKLVCFSKFRIETIDAISLGHKTMHIYLGIQFLVQAFVYSIWLFLPFLRTRKFRSEYRNIEINILKYRKFIVIQKQPSKGVLKKRCSENMQQTYRRTPTPNTHAEVRFQ